MDDSDQGSSSYKDTDDDDDCEKIWNHWWTLVFQIFYTMVCFNNPKTFLEEFGQELHLDPAFPNEFDNVTGNLEIV